MNHQSSLTETFQLPADGGSIGLVSEACVLLCKTITLSRVVEKLHKWHRNSFAFGVDVDVDAMAGERFIADEDEMNDFGVDKVGVAWADFKDIF